MPSIKWNEYWDRYDWSQDGDEWSGQAEYCNQPYELWKKSLIETFVKENLRPTSVALEIAPGHGRWSSYLVQNTEHVHLVDLNPSCIAFCKERFSDFNNVSYHINNGKSLSFIEPSTIDFVWSYDSFVHMDRGTIGYYFDAFSTVLKPGGKAVVHHAGLRHAMLYLSFLALLGKPGRWLYRILAMKRDTAGGGDGDRSHVSNEVIRHLANKAGLAVLYQVDSWGKENRFNCKRFNDTITGLERKV